MCASKPSSGGNYSSLGGTCWDLLIIAAALRVGYLMQHGFTKADASAGVLGVVYDQIGRQSLFLAFMDCFRVIGWVTLAMIPLVLAIRTIKAAGSNVSAH